MRCARSGIAAAFDDHPNRLRAAHRAGLAQFQPQVHDVELAQHNMDIGIPFVVSKYNGVTPHPTGLVDYGAYHGTFQDVRLALRYNLMSGSVVSLTPFAGTIVPSHAYEFFAPSLYNFNSSLSIYLDT